MKASLNLSTQQKLTPQLQQAIGMMQLTAFDLQQLITLNTDLNPFLETDVLADPQDELDNDDDVQWSDLYSPFDKTAIIEKTHKSPKSLKTHLLETCHLSKLSDKDKLIASYIIDAINDNGFLEEKIKILDINESEIESVRHYLQTLEPLGCCSYNLVECLLVQLNFMQCPKATKDIIKNNLDLVALRDYQKLKKIYDLTDAKLANILKIIISLHPKPGKIYDDGSNELNYVLPELRAYKSCGNWFARLEQNALPQVSIKIGAIDNEWSKKYFQEAQWFVKSLKNRNKTLVRVANYLLEFQQLALDKGTNFLKPLTLANVAEKLDLHLSTVSRITTQKFIVTPLKTFELREFFSSPLGDNFSQNNVKYLIKQCINDENKSKPLSDNKIVIFLVEKGVKIARRTVAKYRESMGFNPAHQRKIN